MPIWVVWIQISDIQEAKMCIDSNFFLREE
jgi:hypothetical protein